MRAGSAYVLALLVKTQAHLHLNGALAGSYVCALGKDEGHEQFSTFDGHLGHGDHCYRRWVLRASAWVSEHGAKRADKRFTTPRSGVASANDDPSA